MSSEAPEPRADQRLARGRSTRTAVLVAAADVLREQGHGGASMRAVAERAGVRLSLVQYHFGSKSGLLVAVLEHLTEDLLERQQALWDDGRAFAEQWRTACAYLGEDVESGYVRTLWELWVAGLADPVLAARWRTTQEGWKRLILERVERWRDTCGVELPMSPVALTTLMANLFEGAETEILAGFDRGPHLEALEACAVLIEAAERGGRPGS